MAEKGHCGFTSGFSIGGCSIDIVEYGRRDWWVHVKGSSGLTGWVLAASLDGDKHWFANFYPLCPLRGRLRASLLQGAEDARERLVLYCASDRCRERAGL